MENTYKNYQRNRLISIYAFLIFNVAGFIYYIHFFHTNGYLPSPFIYDKSNTFMDLFNPMYWAYDDARYTEWGSIYPPLNFLVLRLVNFLFAGGNFGDPAQMRENSKLVIVAICLAYLLIPAVMLRTKSWKIFSDSEKTVLYFVIILCSPMLFTLERGNLILFAPLFLSFVLTEIGFLRAAYIAVLVNIKPYFVIFLLYYIIRKNWKGFIICVMMCGFIFLFCGLILEKNCLIFFFNIFSFSQKNALFSLREMMAFPSSISAFTYVLSHPEGANLAARFFSPTTIHMCTVFIETVKWSILVFSLFVLFAKSKILRDAEIFILLTVLITNFGVWAGGYTFIFYISLIPFIIKLEKKLFYFVLILFIVLPLDIIPLMMESIGTQYSYLASANIEIVWTLGLGSVLRPIVNLIFLLLLTFEFYSKKSKRSLTHFQEL